VKAVDEVQQQTDVMYAKILDPKSTKLLRGADVWPSDQAFSRREVLVSSPKEGASALVNLLDHL
jgi:predicted DNA-binding helix-hairpin-helix protein